MRVREDGVGVMKTMIRPCQHEDRDGWGHFLMFKLFGGCSGGVEVAFEQRDAWALWAREGDQMVWVER